MLVKLVLCALAWRCAVGEGAGGEEWRPVTDDELLEGIGGPRLCLSTLRPRNVSGASAGGGCDAALWRRRWAVARTSCLAHYRSSDQLYALRLVNTLSCRDHIPELDEFGAPLVISINVHPSWFNETGRRRHDLALVEVNHPFDARDPLSKHHLLDEFTGWMEEVYTKNYKKIDMPGSMPPNMEYLVSSPLVFVTTIILPLVMFMGAFLFITFCTGTPVKVPYTNVDYSEITPFMKHEYILQAPNYPEL